MPPPLLPALLPEIAACSLMVNVLLLLRYTPLPYWAVLPETAALPLMLNVLLLQTYTPPPPPSLVSLETLPEILPPYMLNVPLDTCTPPPLPRLPPQTVPPYMLNVPPDTPTPRPLTSVARKMTPLTVISPLASCTHRPVSSFLNVCGVSPPSQSVKVKVMFSLMEMTG